MNFTVSTKPLKDALNLGIIKSNVSKFYQKSCLAQVTYSKSELKINLESSSVLSELKLKGYGDEDVTSIVCVDCLLLKDLVNTFDSDRIVIEFTNGGLIFYSDNSKFILNKIIDNDDFELNTPNIITSEAEVIELNKNSWKFVADHQMYAIATSFVHPIYTNVWIGQDGKILVGDFDNSIFTLSTQSNLNDTCILSADIINLFNSLPEGTKIIKIDDRYVAHVEFDSFDYLVEFTSKYENEENGSYNSDIILSLMDVEDTSSITVNIDRLKKVLRQSILISENSEDVISFNVSGSEVSVKNYNADCCVSLDTPSLEEYTLSFNAQLFSNMLSNMDETIVKIAPLKQTMGDEGETITGILCYTPKLTVVLAGIVD